MEIRTPLGAGLPATAIVNLSRHAPVATGPARIHEADEALLAAVKYPPRVGETRPIAALLPQVLARYGLGEPMSCDAPCGATFDVTA